MAQSARDELKKSDTLNDADREKIVGLLQKAYNMEIETVANYIANSIHLDGMLATEVKESMEEDVQEELGHARRVANRLKILGGAIPGSQALEMTQTTLQPPENTIDVLSVIRGVIDGEAAAIDQYQKIIHTTGDDLDPVTNDLAIELKGEEEEHRREFVGFLREYEAMQQWFK